MHICLLLQIEINGKQYMHTQVFNLLNFLLH